MRFRSSSRPTGEPDPLQDCHFFLSLILNHTVTQITPVDWRAAPAEADAQSHGAGYGQRGEHDGRLSLDFLALA
jgi:hypothetical protein